MALPGAIQGNSGSDVAATGDNNVKAVVPTCGSSGDMPVASGHAQLMLDSLLPGHIDLFATGFTPGSPIVIRIQAPLAVGNALLLAVTQADGNGLVRISLVLPAALSFVNGLFMLLVFGPTPRLGCVGLSAAPPPIQVLAHTVARAFVLGKSVLDPGASTSADGQGCAAGSSVVFTLTRGAAAVARPTVDGEGSFKGSISVPKNATLGEHTVVATCGDVVQSDPVTVVAGGTSLPFTGADILSLLMIALASPARERHRRGSQGTAIRHSPSRSRAGALLSCRGKG
ncbi:MAG: hypothetical protein ACRDJU_07635 [Actinomycetota bacterium]